METGQLASWTEETSTIASRRGATSNTYTEHLSSHFSDRSSEPHAPTQLTLDTPRAGARAAGISLSEEHRALPDCDVNESRASAAPGSVAARMLIPPVFAGHAISWHQGALFATSDTLGTARETRLEIIRVHRWSESIGQFNSRTPV